MTFYRSTDDLPPFEDYNMDNRTYKYFSGSALYPFGYGLSYTSFTHTAAPFDAQSRTVTVCVKNTGGITGTDTVCLFMKRVRGEGKERYRLLGFKKAALGAGEEKQLTFEIEAQYMEKIANGEYEIVFEVE